MLGFLLISVLLDEDRCDWCCMPAIPEFEKLRQEDVEFEVILGYITRLYLKKTNNPENIYG
jgi:hypothetical protein